MRNKILLALVAFFLGTGLYIVHTPRELVAPEIPALVSMPANMGPWHSVHDTIFDAPTLNVLRPTDYLMRTYVNNLGQSISLYVGYHDGSPSAGPIHSPKNCLPGGGWEFKTIENATMNTADSDIDVVRAVLTKSGDDMTFYYWYQVRGEVITSELDMKIAEFMGMVTDNRKDAAFIRIGITIDDEELELQTMQNFFLNAYPYLKNYLPS